MSSQSLQGNIIRTLSQSGDFTYGNNISGYLVENAAIGQDITTAIALQLGECFWAINQGINWFSWLGSKNPNGLNLAIASVILNRNNVLGLNGPPYVLNRNSRAFDVTWDVITVFSSSFPGTSNIVLVGE